MDWIPAHKAIDDELGLSQQLPQEHQVIHTLVKDYKHAVTRTVQTPILLGIVKHISFNSAIGFLPDLTNLFETLYGAIC